MSSTLPSSTPKIRRDRNIGLGLIIVFLLCMLVPWLYTQPWSGLGSATVTTTAVEDQSTGTKTIITQEFQPGKTLWDWFALLVVPLVLAVAAYWFNKSERQNDQRIEEQHAQDDALQAYLDRMNELLLKDNLARAEKDASVRDVARILTLTVLRRLNGARKGIVLRFLYEADLIGSWKVEGEPGSPKVNETKPIVMLDSADLDGVVLESAKLDGADLSGVSLIGASLRWTACRHTRFNYSKLAQANLSSSDLQEATFLLANLKKAILIEAYLKWTNMCFADWEGVNFSKARLPYADLRRAKLSEAQITSEQLSQCHRLYGCKMQDGAVYDGRFNLQGDVEDAKFKGINVDDPEAMRK